MSGEKLRSSRATDIKQKITDAEKQKQLDEYMHQREQYYKKSTRLDTEQERKQLEEEFDAQLDRLTTGEKPAAESAKTEQDPSKDVAALLDGMDMDVFDCVELPPLVVDEQQKTINGIPLTSAHGISLCMQSYSGYSAKTAEYFGSISEQFLHFQGALEKYKKLESEYDMWSWMSGGKKEFKAAMEAMQAKITILKEKFAQAQKTIQTARKNIDTTGKLLNNAPEGLMLQEDALQAQTQGELSKQQDVIVAKVDEAINEKIALETKKSELEAQRAQLERYQDMLQQGAAELSVQKSDVVQARQFEEKAITDKLTRLNLQLKTGGISRSFTREDMVQIARFMDSEDVSGLTLFLGGDEEVTKFATIQQTDIFHDDFDDIIQGRQRVLYFSGLESQYNQAAQDLTIRGEDVKGFSTTLDEHSSLLDTDISTLDSQIVKLAFNSDQTVVQYTQQAEKHEVRRSQQDVLDQQVAGLVMDTNINVASFESAAGVYATSVSTVEFDEPSGLTMFWRGTAGKLMKGVKRGVDGLHTVLTYLPEKLDALCQNMRSDAKQSGWGYKILAHGLSAINEVAIQPATGVVDAAAGLLDGVATMIEHPVDTLAGLGTLVGMGDTPAGEAWAAMGTFMFGSAEERQNNTGRTAGRALGNVASFFIGAGELNAVAKAGQAGRAASLAATASKAGALASKMRYVQAATASLARSTGSGLVSVGKTVVQLPGKLLTGTVNVGKGVLSLAKKTGRVQVAASTGKFLVKTRDGVASGSKSFYESGKQSLEFVKNNPKQLVQFAVEMTSGLWLARGMYRMSKGEPFFGKFFKDAKATAYLQEYDLAVGEIQKMQGEKVSLSHEISSYMDFDLLTGKAIAKPGVNVANIPRDRVVSYNKLVDDIGLIELRVNHFRPFREQLRTGDPPVLTDLGKLFDEQIAFRKMIDDIVVNPENMGHVERMVEQFNAKGIDLSGYGKIDEVFDVGVTGEGKVLVLEDGKIVIKTDKVRIYTHAEHMLDKTRVTYSKVSDDIARLEAEIKGLDANPPAYDNHLAQLKETLQTRRQQQMQLYDEIEALKAQQSSRAAEFLAEPVGEVQPPVAASGTPEVVSPKAKIKIQGRYERGESPLGKKKATGEKPVVVTEKPVVLELESGAARGSKVAPETQVQITALEEKLAGLSKADAVFYELNIESLVGEIKLQAIAIGKQKTNMYGVKYVYDSAKGTVEFVDAGRTVTVSVDEFARHLYSQKVKTLNGEKGFATAEEVLTYEVTQQVEQVVATANGRGGKIMLEDGTVIKIRYNQYTQGSGGSFEGKIGTSSKLYTKEEVVNYITAHKKQRMIEQQRVLIQGEIDRLRLDVSRPVSEVLPVRLAGEEVGAIHLRTPDVSKLPKGTKLQDAAGREIVFGKAEKGNVYFAYTADLGNPIRMPVDEFTRTFKTNNAMYALEGNGSSVATLAAGQEVAGIIQQVEALGLPSGLADEVGAIIVTMRTNPKTPLTALTPHISGFNVYKRAAVLVGIQFLMGELLGKPPTKHETDEFFGVIAKGLEPSLEDTEKVILLLGLGSTGEIKGIVQDNKDLFKSMLLIPEKVGSSTYVVNFNALQSGGIDGGSLENYTGLEIRQQKSILAIKSIGLGDVLDEGTHFVVTSRADGIETERIGSIKNGRPQDDQGKYIPIWQGDRVEIIPVA